MKLSRKNLLVSIAILCLAVLSPQPIFAETRHQLLTDVLASHVSGGEINFTDLCRDERLTQFTEQLNQTDPQSFPDKNDQFAFWLNAYNAYSLKAICKKYPIKSIDDLNFGGLVVSVVLKKSVWDRPTVMVNRKAYTLRQVDHEILRPMFKDPRIQFAIACGAKGCAPSRSEAYEGATLNEQLDDQARIFINDPTINTFNPATMTARISTLFNWSQKDFANNERDMLLYIAGYLPDDIKQNILTNVDSWTIKYGKYDLTLNDTKKNKGR